MHGEGNLLTHLVILGYKLSHQQVSYSFHMLCSFTYARFSVRVNKREAASLFGCLGNFITTVDV